MYETYNEIITKLHLQSYEDYANSDDWTYPTIAYSEYILNSTDYKVMQYIRECNLAIETTLTKDEYIKLEELREECVNTIRKGVE